VRRIDRAFELFARTLLVLYFFYVLASWISQRETFKITAVVVEGTLAVDPEKVVGNIESFLREPLLWRIDRNNSVLYPKRAIRKAILELNPRVKQVSLVLDEDKRMVASVEEYVPTLLWCPPEHISATTTIITSCYFSDSVGHIFAPAPDYSGNPFLVFATTFPNTSEGVAPSGQSILPADEFAKVNSFLRQLSGLGLTSRVVREVGVHDFIVLTDKPWTIRFLSTNDPVADGANLALVLENLTKDEVTLDALESIDLRFGNKVFYR